MNETVSAGVLADVEGGDLRAAARDAGSVRLRANAPAALGARPAAAAPGARLAARRKEGGGMTATAERHVVVASATSGTRRHAGVASA